MFSQGYQLVLDIHIQIRVPAVATLESFRLPGEGLGSAFMPKHINTDLFKQHLWWLIKRGAMWRVAVKLNVFLRCLFACILLFFTAREMSRLCTRLFAKMQKKMANCKANVWVDFVRFTIRARQQFMYITDAFISWKKCLNKLNVDTLSLSVFSKVESLSVSNTWNSMRRSYISSVTLQVWPAYWLGYSWATLEIFLFFFKFRRQRKHRVAPIRMFVLSKKQTNT